MYFVKILPVRAKVFILGSMLVEYLFQIDFVGWGQGDYLGKHVG